MTVGVVDHLEPVDVEYGHRQRGPGPHRAGHFRGRLALPGRRVQQARLRIGPRVVDQLDVPQRPLQQRDDGQRGQGEQRVTGHAVGHQDAYADLGPVVVQRLAAEHFDSDTHGRVGALTAVMTMVLFRTDFTRTLTATSKVHTVAWLSVPPGVAGTRPDRPWKVTDAAP